MNTIMWWIWSFFRLIRTCGYTGANCNRANNQLSHLYANSSCKGVLRAYTAEYRSELTTKSRSSGEMEAKSDFKQVSLGLREDATRALENINIAQHS